jgi:ribosomal protein S18 acetylase RimI-like enzyme
MSFSQAPFEDDGAQQELKRPCMNQTENSPIVCLLPQDEQKSLIYLYEWVGNDKILQTFHGFASPPPIKLRNLFSSSAPNPSPSSEIDPVSTMPWFIHVDQIISLHKAVLPKDELPGTFLSDIVVNQKGKIILACQFSPLPLATTNPPSDSDRNRSNGVQINVVGCIAGLFMQFWSRMAGAEFSLKRILNIFSLFVDNSMHGQGLGKALMDAITFVFHPKIINLDYSYDSSHAAKASCKDDANIDNLNDQSTHSELQNELKNTKNTKNTKNVDIKSPKPQYPNCIDEISLEVRATNTKAIKLYEGKGFKTQNIEKGYYPHGLNARDKTMHEMVVDYVDYKYWDIVGFGTAVKALEEGQ